MGKIDKFLKFIWAFNGILFILFVYFSISNRIGYLFKGYPKRIEQGLIVGSKLDTAVSKGVRLQRLVPVSPKLIEKSGYYFIPLTQYDLEQPVIDRNRPAEQRVYVNVYSNILFTAENGNDSHLLINKRVGISRYFIPEIGSKIYYLVIEEDTNKDDRLNQRDLNTLYSSNLSGKDLKRYAWDNCRIKSFEYKENDKIAFLRLIYDQNLDGQFNEADYEILKKLNLETGLIEDVLSEKTMDEIHKKIFR